MFKHNYKNFEAFTFIELLVVISIIGILSTVSIVSYNAVRAKERDNRRATDMNKISVSFENYRSLYGYYPVFSPGCDHGTPLSSADYNVSNGIPATSPWFTCLGDLLKPFIGNIPVDPKNIPGKGYCYNIVTSSSGDSIYISFFLENGKAISSISNAVIDTNFPLSSSFYRITYNNLVW